MFLESIGVFAHTGVGSRHEWIYVSMWIYEFLELHASTSMHYHLVSMCMCKCVVLALRGC